MIVVRPEMTFRPIEVMERSVLTTLRLYTQVGVRLLSERAAGEASVRFLIGPGSGSATERIQVEAVVAGREGGTHLPATITLFSAEQGKPPTAYHRELATYLAGQYKGYVWEPDPRDVEQLTLPDVHDPSERRSEVRKDAPESEVVTKTGRHAIRDLSLDGLSFHASRQYRRGELLAVTLGLPDGQTLELLLRVRWQTKSSGPDGTPMGGEIVAMREDDRMRLAAYLGVTV